MNLLQYFKQLTIHPKNASELKGLILQLAIQGKLTQKWREQNPDVEPASVLLEKIKAEKEQLIKEKKSKKEKPLSEIEEGEIPFELPENWIWCKIGNVSSLINGDRGKNYPSKSHYISEGIPFITARNLGDRFLKHDTLNYISEERFTLLRSGQVLLGDILYCLRGSLGKCSIVEGINRGAIASSLVIVRTTELVDSIYLLNYLSSALGKQMIYKYDNGTAQPNLSATDVNEYLLPFPPLEEQKAIVATVNQLFTEVEELEVQTKEQIRLKEDFVQSALKRLTGMSGDTHIANEWAFIQPHFKTFFNTKDAVKKLRESILQLAVQGKLTQHWRSTQDAQNSIDFEEIELLRMEYQKESAIRKGQKIFKYKKSVPIDIGGKTKGVDSLFEIPANWVWTSLGQITWSINDGPHFSPKYVDEGVPMISGRNVTFENGIDFTSAKFVSREDHIEFTKRGKPEVGDVLLTKGGTTGVSCVVETDKEFSIWVHVALIKMLKEYVDPYYLNLSLASPFVYKQSQVQTHGIGNKDLGLTRMVYFAIPLPPLEEQKAIVAKVNSLMALCDQLEQEIELNTKQVEDLMRSCLREVFG